MSSIANAQAGMGYQKAKQRPSCSNCKHGMEDMQRGCPTWRCELANFLTSALATCTRHQARSK